MFIDEVSIQVKAGDGGNGMVGFRREKYVPHGGPSGGDGGRGGDIALLADGHLTTLLDFRYKHRYKADKGGDGGNNNMTGKDAEDLVLKVPVGTQAYNAATGELLVDMVEEGERVVLAHSGRGGRGNARFASPTRQTPQFAENGEPGEELQIRLELKLLADVGLLGFPSVGKSSLIAQVSAARPKIADYPFTTLVPNLGVVRVDEERSFVMADIPGIIEGAHSGTGLGIQFLRHVERTRLLVHILDVSGFTGREPIQDLDILNRELHLYSDTLATVPQVVALNKIDVAGARDRAEEILPILEARGLKVFLISAATGEGTQQLVYFLGDELQNIERMGPSAAEMQEVLRIAPSTYDPRHYEIKKPGDHEFVVEGKGIERSVAMSNMDNEESVKRLHRKLERMGIIDALKKAGATDGDTVRIGSVEFDYIGEEDV
jgi:GTP-binding protein